MRVRNLELRFMFDRRVRPGEIVEWPDDKPIPRGMEPVDGAAPAVEAPAEPAAEQRRRGRKPVEPVEPRTFGELARMDAAAMEVRVDGKPVA